MAVSVRPSLVPPYADFFKGGLSKAPVALQGEHMKTIGLLGGMSWESTLTYYQIINMVTAQTLGGLTSHYFRGGFKPPGRGSGKEQCSHDDNRNRYRYGSRD